MLDRRTFLSALTGTLFASPLRHSQQESPAKALGLTIPQSLLQRVDQVIE